MKNGFGVFGVAILILSGAASAQSDQEIQDNIPNEIADNLTRDSIDEYKDRAQEINNLTGDDVDEYRDRAQEINNLTEDGVDEYKNRAQGAVSKFRTFSERARGAYQGENTVRRVERQCAASDAALRQITEPSSVQANTSVVVRNTGDRGSRFLLVVSSSSESTSNGVILPIGFTRPGNSSLVTVRPSLNAKIARVHALADASYGDNYFTPVCGASGTIELRDVRGRQSPSAPGEESAGEQQIPTAPEAGPEDSQGDAEPQDQPGLVEQVLGGIL